jgi:phage repressor protein C with HTH and peptisase S24 domain
VDRGVNEISMDGVFVLSRNGELFIKRVQRRMRDGAIIIKSDNALFEPETIENAERERLEILGRVLWVWRGAKL